MTCIVGVTHENKVYMGADSCGSNLYSWQTVGNNKVFEVGDFLIGCTTSFRMIDLLTYSLTGVIQRPEDSDDKFVRTTFINSVIDCFKANDFGESGKGGNFLLGYKGKLYEVQDDFSILNSPAWGASVGSGEQSARGSLWSTLPGQIKLNEETALAIDPKQRVFLALSAAEACVPSVRGPFVVLVK